MWFFYFLFCRFWMISPESRVKRVRTSENSETLNIHCTFLRCCIPNITCGSTYKLYINSYSSWFNHLIDRLARDEVTKWKLLHGMNVNKLSFVIITNSWYWQDSQEWCHNMTELLNLLWTTQGLEECEEVRFWEISISDKRLGKNRHTIIIWQVMRTFFLQ